MSGSILGLPRTTPWSRLIASAALVLSPISRLSSSANTQDLAMARSAGVVVSTGASSATSPQPTSRIASSTRWRRGLIGLACPIRDHEHMTMTVIEVFQRCGQGWTHQGLARYTGVGVKGQ